MCHRNQLSESALNHLFQNLPVCKDKNGKLGCLLNPGNGKADESIATAKGWEIRKFL
jgi:hypothetical protein